MRRYRILVLVFGAVWLLLSGRPLVSSGQTTDNWYSIRIAGKKAGYLHQRTEQVALGGEVRFKTLAESRMVVDRLGTLLEIKSSEVYLETEDGDLLEVSSELGLSNIPMKSEARVEDGQVVLKSYLGGSSAAQERKIPFSGRLLGPEGIRRTAEKELINPGDTVTFQSFLSEFSQLVTVTQTLTGLEPLPDSRPPREALRVTEWYSAYPQKRTVWLDTQGRTLLSSDTSPFGELTTRLAGREEALDISPAGSVPVLSFQDVLAKSNIRLAQARLLEAVTLRLERKTAAEGDGWPDLSGPGQTVLEKTDRYLLLKVERPRPVSIRPAAPAPESKDVADFLLPNQYLNIQDELLQRSAYEALGGENSETDPLRRALRLENWVSERMRFDLGIAFAPSSEVVRNLKGTCAEYAVLLAAMLRAAGIPARFLMGYVYLDGIWGGHAWAEAFIDGKWLPLDAAVNGPGIADAARFALIRSSLNDGLGSLLSEEQMLMGNLNVTVLSYSREGRTVDVDPRAPLHLVLGDLYLNAGLGLGVRKPRAFVFEDLDKTWPDNTLLAMKGPRGQTIRVLQDAWRPGGEAHEAAIRRLEDLVPGGRRSFHKVSGKNSSLVTAEGRAAAAVLNGADVWLITAEGDNAAGLLSFVLGSFSAGTLLPPPREEF